MRVAEYTIDRGRSYELDRVRHGPGDDHDPRHRGRARPDQSRQPLLGRDRAAEAGAARALEPGHRGLVHPLSRLRRELRVRVRPSQLVNTVTISLVDIFELVSAMEMHPGKFGDTRRYPTASTGQVYYDETPDDDVHGMQLRVDQILDRRRDPGRVQGRLLRQRLPEGDRLLAGRVGDDRDPGRRRRRVPRGRQRLRRPPGPAGGARPLRPLRPAGDGGGHRGLGLPRLEGRRRGSGRRLADATRPTSAASR